MEQADKASANIPASNHFNGLTAAIILSENESPAMYTGLGNMAK
jgi:hypothetical protein